MRLRRTLLFVALLGSVQAVSQPRFAHAQETDPLTKARQLFAEGLDDEEHQRFAAALEKYQRVREVRDTASVRYRIGAALEGLGKIAQAVDSYQAAIKNAQETPSDADIVNAARARIDALAPRIAHLKLKPPSPPPAELDVTVDNTRVPPEAMADVRVDPGSHAVSATAKGTKPFRLQVSVAEGATAEVPLTLEPEAPPPPPPPPPSSSPLRTVGIVVGATGAVIAVSGAIVLSLRSSNISKLEEECPNNACPKSRESELQDVHDRAVTQGPLGAGLLIGGGALIGAGVVLFILGRPDSKTSARIVPSHGGGMLSFSRSF